MTGVQRTATSVMQNAISRMLSFDLKVDGEGARC
jgi:hypothetical protein